MKYDQELVSIRKTLIRKGKPMMLKDIYETLNGEIEYYKLSKILNYPIARFKYKIVKVDKNHFEVR